MLCLAPSGSVPLFQRSVCMAYSSYFRSSVSRSSSTALFRYSFPVYSHYLIILIHSLFFCCFMLVLNFNGVPPEVPSLIHLLFFCFFVSLSICHGVLPSTTGSKFNTVQVDARDCTHDTGVLLGHIQNTRMACYGVTKQVRKRFPISLIASSAHRRQGTQPAAHDTGGIPNNTA